MKGLWGDKRSDRGLCWKENKVDKSQREACLGLWKSRLAGAVFIMILGRMRLSAVLSAVLQDCKLRKLNVSSVANHGRGVHHTGIITISAPGSESVGERFISLFPFSF